MQIMVPDRQSHRRDYIHSPVHMRLMVSAPVNALCMNKASAVPAFAVAQKIHIKDLINIRLRCNPVADSGSPYVKPVSAYAYKHSGRKS